LTYFKIFGILASLAVKINLLISGKEFQSPNSIKFVIIQEIHS